MGLDDGTSWNELRADFKNACPDRLPDLEKVYAGLHEVDTVCSLDPADRPETQRQLAQAMAC
jgi:hypothetical protein